MAEQHGAQIDIRLHPPATAARSAMHDFAEAILAGRPHPAPGEEGLVVTELLDAIYASARLGEPVKVGA